MSDLVLKIVLKKENNLLAIYKKYTKNKSVIIDTENINCSRTIIHFHFFLNILAPFWAPKKMQRNTRCILFFLFFFFKNFTKNISNNKGKDETDQKSHDQR